MFIADAVFVKASDYDIKSRVLYTHLLNNYHNPLHQVTIMKSSNEGLLAAISSCILYTTNQLPNNVQV
jgi:hypothetical protein